MGTGVEGRHRRCHRQQDMVPVCPSKWFPSGRMGQDVSRMGKRGGEVVFMAITWSQARKELTVGFPNIINGGDEDWDVVATL